VILIRKRARRAFIPEVLPLLPSLRLAFRGQDFGCGLTPSAAPARRLKLARDDNQAAPLPNLLTQPLGRILTLSGLEESMATRRKSRGREYGKAAGKRVASAMRRKKRGTLKSGKGGKGGKVKSRKQAIAIGLSEARRKGAKVPKKKAA
jgi:Family of unknown function (DUF6496)